MRFLVKSLRKNVAGVSLGVVECFQRESPAVQRVNDGSANTSALSNLSEELDVNGISLRMHFLCIGTRAAKGSGGRERVPCVDFDRQRHPSHRVGVYFRRIPAVFPPPGFPTYADDCVHPNFRIPSRTSYICRSTFPILPPPARDRPIRPWSLDFPRYLARTRRYTVAAKVLRGSPPRTAAWPIKNYASRAPQTVLEISLATSRWNFPLYLVEFQRCNFHRETRRRRSLFSQLFPHRILRPPLAMVVPTGERDSRDPRWKKENRRIQLF